MARVLKEDWLAVAEGSIYPDLHPAGSELQGELLQRAEKLGKMVESKARGVAKNAAEAEAAKKAAEGGNA